MHDELKKLVEAERSTFDVYEFDEKLGWEELSTHLVPKTKHRIIGYKWYGIAAGILMLITSLVVFRNVGMNNQAAMPAEVVEIQQYYQQMIDDKVVLISNQLGDEILTEDLTRMSEAFAELKVDLGDNAQNEEVILAMIDNYRLKLKALERILNEIEEKNGKDTSL